MKVFFGGYNCSQLKFLKLSWCDLITGKTLIHIMDASKGNMQGLEKLYINDTNAERKMIMDFMKICPKVEVIYNHDFDLISEEKMKEHKIPSGM